MVLCSGNNWCVSSVHSYGDSFFVLQVWRFKKGKSQKAEVYGMKFPDTKVGRYDANQLCYEKGYLVPYSKTGLHTNRGCFQHHLPVS